MKIPEKIRICGFDIYIKYVDSLGDHYGEFCDVTNTITLAKTIMVNDKVYSLSERQIYHTYLHELIHAIQWYTTTEYDETQAQTWANILLEISENDNLPF